MFGKSTKPSTKIDSLIGVGTVIEGNVIFSGGLSIDKQHGMEKETHVAAIDQRVAAHMRGGQRTAKADFIRTPASQVAQTEALPCHHLPAKTISRFFNGYRNLHPAEIRCLQRCLVLSP